MPSRRTPPGPVVRRAHEGNRELNEAITEIDVLVDPEADLATRVSRIAAAIAATITAHPVLCDLISAQAAVPERNVSTDVVLRHKRATFTSVIALIGQFTRHVPELDERETIEVIAMTILLIAGARPQTQPTGALLAAYAEDPSIAQFNLEFADVVARSIDLTAFGLLAHRGALPAQS